ncbi:MAG: hypothetical protein LH649_06880 [Pseudanabaena sp. CAN_BIN31]|nr:hypothetical protein [Pseudanabaena sp. CAN_BIN31]
MLCFPAWLFLKAPNFKLCAGRKSFGGATVRLEPDVAAVFPNADAVNEALRFMIRVMQQNQSTNLAVLTEVQKQ